MFNPCHACGRSQIHDVVYINSHQTVFHYVSGELLDRCVCRPLARPQGGRARPVRFPALQSCSHEEHIKCSSARAELAINLTGRARPPVGEQAAETRSVQSNIVRTEFWLMTCSRQKLDRQPSLCPFISCGEIGTEFGVESFKQSLFHRNLFGMKKAEALERVSAFVTGAILFANCWIRPGER